MELTSKLIGFPVQAQAIAAGRKVTNTPKVRQLKSGAFVGVGETVLVDPYTNQHDTLLCGAQGTCMWTSAAKAAGLL